MEGRLSASASRDEGWRVYSGQLRAFIVHSFPVLPFFFFGRVIIYFFDTYTDGAESSVRARGKARVQQEMEEEEVHQAE